LLSVIVGWQADLIAVTKVVADIMPNLPVKYAVRDQYSYRLNISNDPPPRLSGISTWRPYNFRSR
jgi:hypothetical protein